MRALEAEPSLHCVGTHAWFFQDDPKIVEEVIAKPERHEDITRAFLLGSPIVHGSIVVSRSALLDVGGYNERYRYSADLELYSRFLAKYRAANIQKQLLGVRRHAKQGSMTKVAADENIDIFTRLISTRWFSPEDLPTVFASLSYFYLSRARLLARDGDYAGFASDLGSAFRFAPGTATKISTRYFVVKPVRGLWKRVCRPHDVGGHLR